MTMMMVCLLECFIGFGPSRERRARRGDHTLVCVGKRPPRNDSTICLWKVFPAPSSLFPFYATTTTTTTTTTNTMIMMIGGSTSYARVLYRHVLLYIYELISLIIGPTTSTKKFVGHQNDERTSRLIFVLSL
jgi:hypothetical protein